MDIPIQQGLLPADARGNFYNHVLLCGTCHDNFDDIAFPGFIFVPTDLDYFIQEEEKDFARRTAYFQEHGLVLTREFPTPDDYQLHSIGTTNVSSGPSGGLYNCYILRDYFPTRLLEALGPNPYFGPKPWPGFPYAAIQRSQFTLVIAVNMVRRDIEDKLFRLIILYNRRIEGSQPSFPRSPSYNNSQAVTQPPRATADKFGPTPANKSTTIPPNQGGSRVLLPHRPRPAPHTLQPRKPHPQSSALLVALPALASTTTSSSPTSSTAMAGYLVLASQTVLPVKLTNTTPRVSSTCLLTTIGRRI